MNLYICNVVHTFMNGSMLSQAHWAEQRQPVMLFVCMVLIMYRHDVSAEMWHFGYSETSVVSYLISKPLLCHI